MELSLSLEDIEYAENFLASGDIATALPLLLELVDAAEEYIEAACQPTDTVQYFSFADDFERLAYRRVEDDPRRLVQVPLPFDRLYADTAYAYIQEQEYQLAREALMQAVRWNPMDCLHRLDLAEVCRALEDEREWAALSASVVERASDARALGLAYANLGRYFLGAAALNDGAATAGTAAAGGAAVPADLLAAEACSRLAARYAPREQRAQQLRSVMEREHAELAQEPDERVMEALTQAGVAAGPSADIAICLVSCATDAAAAGRINEATELIIRARDLVGQETCAQLIRMVREADAERAAAAEAGAAEPDAAPGLDAALGPDGALGPDSTPGPEPAPGPVAAANPAQKEV